MIFYIDWGFFVWYHSFMKCFECDSIKNIIKHHVVPRSKGGTRTVLLCQVCHDKVHNISPRDISISELTKKALFRAKKRGVKLGGPNPKKSVKLMNKGAVKAKNEFRIKITPIINEIRSTGVSTLQGIADCLNMKGISTRTGKTWTPGLVRNVII